MRSNTSAQTKMENPSNYLVIGYLYTKVGIG